MNMMNVPNDQLQTVLELTKLLNSSQDVDYILSHMMHQTIELLERADIGVIFLYDKKEDLLKLKTAIGFGDINVSMRPGESITGIAFNRRKTLHLKSHQEMREAMSSMRESNYSQLSAKIDKPMEELQSSISCPLMQDDECIGVLVIDNYYGKPPLNEEDVYLAEMISLHATIAIVNASNYEKLTEQKHRLEHYSQMVEKEKDRYEYSTYLHNKFTEMVLNGSVVEDIVAEVSKMLSRDVFTLDILYRISHHSVGIQTTYESLKDARMAYTLYLSQFKQSVFFCKEISQWMYFNPIRVNNEILGWVGVVSESSEFNELERIAIDKCSTIIALEMLKDDELMTLEQSLKGDFLENLLADSSTEFMQKFTERYHYDFDQVHQLIIMKVDFEEIDALHGKYLRYLYREVRQLNLETLSNVITLQKRNYIITIFDSTELVEREIIDHLIEKVFERAKGIFGQLDIKFNSRIGVSSRISSNADFRRAYDQTMQIFNLALLQQQGCVHHYYEDLEIKRFLLNNPKEELEAFARKVLGGLLDYSMTSRADLILTLQHYILSGGNWTQTKDQLHIHGNTLTYRLSRLKDLLGFDFDEYQHRFRIQVALEILELYPDLRRQ